MDWGWGMGDWGLRVVRSYKLGVASKSLLIILVINVAHSCPSIFTRYLLLLITHYFNNVPLSPHLPKPDSLSLDTV
ncbi:MAG: hypothetical protein WBA07_32070, partial [Rivularia sp. (in: cyanobacteria)]